MEWHGRRYHFPGHFNSPESLAAYHDFGRRVLTESPLPALGPRPAVCQVAKAYLTYALAYYGDGQEYGCLRGAVAILVKLYGSTAAADIGPLALEKLRAARVAGGWIRSGENSAAGAAPTPTTR